MKKRVVVTGLGALSAHGHNYKQISKNIFSGQSAISTLDHLKMHPDLISVGAAVSAPKLEEIDYELKTLSRLDPFIIFGLKAAFESIENSQIMQTQIHKDRIGVCIGSGIGGLKTIDATAIKFFEKNLKGVSPFFIPSTLISMLASHIAIRYGFLGPNLAMTSACTSSSHALLNSYDMICADYADVMICGGAEHTLNPLGIAAFQSLKALADMKDWSDPQTLSRPLDRKRRGFVMADGASMLVLESLEHALKRNAPIFAEICGGSANSDAYHITQPQPEGRGALLAMETALKRSQINPEEIDMIHLHATSTPLGDLAELLAIRQLFKNHTNVWLSATKNLTGHLLGAAGALESLICILSLYHQKIPPWINLDDPEDDVLAHRLASSSEQPSHLEYILKNSFAFGGSNCSLIFKRYSEPR